jgi:chitinase
VQRCSYDGPGEVNCAYHEHNTGIIVQAHAQGAEVYPSIGGWTLSDNFPTLSADPVARDNFARKCVEILTHHDFDGIDIDWEYPGYEEHSGTPADTVNFTKMLAAIRAALEQLTRTTGKSYGLTAALPCAPKNIANIEVEKINSYLTEWNLMSYDFHGAWDKVSGVNAPLFYQGHGDEEFSIHRCVENYVARGVPRAKINIGLPFYGRSFKKVTRLNQEHGGNDLGNWPEDDGTPQFFNIWNKLPHMIQMRDNKSKTQIAYISHEEQASIGPNNPDGLAQSLPEGLVSFDDERAICDKVHYAQDRGLAGFIIWELSGDVLHDLSTPLLDITNRKLGDPSLECCALHSQEECEKERLEQESQLSHSQIGGFDSARWGTQGTPGNASRERWTHGGVLLILASSLLGWAMTVNTSFW